MNLGKMGREVRTGGEPGPILAGYLLEPRRYPKSTFSSFFCPHFTSLFKAPCDLATERRNLLSDHCQVCVCHFYVPVLVFNFLELDRNPVLVHDAAHLAHFYLIRQLLNISLTP